MRKVAVVVPNWNGADSLAACLDSLLAQSFKATVVVVENGSIDGSLALLANYATVQVIRHSKNLGFAGGVNSGIRWAMEQGFEGVALFNNDAAADRHWLAKLADCLAVSSEVGIAAGKLLGPDDKHLDSTGDFYSIWGLPYPRGRGETDLDKYDRQADIFGATGGASLYRVSMLEEIGLFDEDFFAYYEDVDLSFRAQLAGWKVRYVPAAVAYHQIGTTSGKIKGFTTYQTLKNLPLLLWKNVPWKLMPKVWPRLALAYWSFSLRALSRGQFLPVLKGWYVSAFLLPKKLVERHRIQSQRKVSVDYIASILIHDLPPNARALRKLRAAFGGKR